MNIVIKTIAIIWLGLCAIAMWFGCAMLGFVTLFSNMSFMYNVTPFIGITCVICIMLMIIRIYKSNPMEYLFGKEKI